MLPRLAITLGDVAGIGPEVTARACADERVRSVCTPIVVGHAGVLRRAVELTGVDLGIDEVDGPDEPSPRVATRGLGPQSPYSVACWNPSGDEAAKVAAGRLDARAGRAAYEWLLAAAGAALEGRVDGIVTAPLNKAALHAAGHRYPGHTEILAEVCGVSRYAMMLHLPPRPGLAESHGLSVAHVTLHTSLASVPRLLTVGSVVERIELLADFLHNLAKPDPRIGVCALNPHAGEEGLFGDEESQIIRPAVERAARELTNGARAGVSVEGPLPADTLFRRAVDGEFDGVVAMYHDQGHIALKLLGFGRAVNVTLGLPIVRTSPSHGTAFDIAWQGVARAEGMIDAIQVAARLAEKCRMTKSEGRKNDECRSPNAEASDPERTPQPMC
ncbi:MAG: 4-hydroxythreonine-4-phosphate dehydrogenase PdxA [Planctomycetes bacterium]|nr:4-hydroxythreonine-4-phosphate dehydrogenase PdxA [Planctomycetota bacterium]